MSINVSTLPGVTETVPPTSPITLGFLPLNFAADWRVIETGPGKVVYTNVQAPIDQPFTIRVQQTLRPNVYSGTGIEPAAQAPTKRGCDTVVEFKALWKFVDTNDLGSVQYYPARIALTMNLPYMEELDGDWMMLELIQPLLGALASSATDASLVPGLTDLLHGVIEKR